MNILSKKIILGTAQLGMKYGITNDNNKPSSVQAHNILDFAYKNGIKFLDTAINYGDSQALIGSFRKQSPFHISTKIPLINLNKAHRNIRDEVTKSLLELRVKCIDCCFLHSTEQLLSDDGEIIWDCMRSLKEEGLIKKIGFSVYDPDEITSALRKKFIPECIQLPVNLFDNRFEKSGLLDRLHALDIEIHARSIFLQGLLLKTSQSLPVHFKKWSTLWDSLDLFLDSNHLDRYQYLLEYILRDHRVSKIIIGISSLAELHYLINNIDKLPIKEFKYFSLPQVDEELIDPRKWN